MKPAVRNILAVVIILAGLAVFAYPWLSELWVQKEARLAAQQIDRLQQTQTTAPTVAATEPAEPTEPTQPAATQPPQTQPPETAPSEMELLLQRIRAYNETIYQQGQSNFRDPFSYETPAIDLREYGFEDDLIATIWIPRLEVELPVYLGATKENLAKGVAVLGQTSIPARGENTNAVIAGHRGYRGAPMFRDIQRMQLGDKITVKTPWETLVYRVCELKIITPGQTHAVLIQPGRQLLTLVTCHPYTKNYQRYLVFAELTEETEQNKEEDLQEAEQTFDETPRVVVSADENGQEKPVQVEPESIKPVADEGMVEEDGAAYSNTLLILEKYAPFAVLLLLAILAAVRLLGKGRKDKS